jgi:hypothetical protein
MKTEMTDALKKDLGKSAFISELTSVQACIWDVEYSLAHVEEVKLKF